MASGRSQLLLGVALVCGGATAEIYRCGFMRVQAALAWTVLEIVVSVLATALLGSIGLFATGRRTTVILDLAVSRGLELAAALPLVLTCSVAVSVYRWALPFAVAIVIGTLNALHCIRVTTVARARSALERQTQLRWSRRLSSYRHAIVAAVSQVVPQVLGLEAAITYLGLLPRGDNFGVGQALGAAVVGAAQANIVAWSLVAVGLSLLTGLSLRVSAQSHRPGPNAQGALQ